MLQTSVCISLCVLDGTWKRDTGRLSCICSTSSCPAPPVLTTESIVWYRYPLQVRIATNVYNASVYDLFISVAKQMRTYSYSYTSWSPYTIYYRYHVDVSLRCMCVELFLCLDDLVYIYKKLA